MPVYLVHGFRWPREGFSGIRVHAVVHNLDDCSVEYIQNEHSRAEILASFRKLYPEIMKELEGPGRKIEFIEQYDPDDVDGPHAVSQPYAFVGDKVVMIAAGPGTVDSTSIGQPGTGIGQTPGTVARTSSAATGQIDSKSPSKKPRLPTAPMSKAAPFNSPADSSALSINVEEAIADGPGLTNKAWEALADLRDKIAEGEKIGWWVVYNGDPERSYDEDEDEENIEDAEGDENTEFRQSQVQGQGPVTSGASSSIARPRTAPTDSTNTVQPRPPVPTVQAAPQQQSLTALPMRPSLPAPAAATAPVPTALPTSRPDKGKQKETVLEPVKPKDNPKSQSLRKKFFGKRQ